MKYILFTLVLMCAAVSSEIKAQDDYEVFKFSKDVTVKKHKKKTWNSVRKRQTLSLNDSIRIGKSSTISVIDRSTNIISRAKKEGAFLVKDILKLSQNVVEAYVETLSEGISDRKRTPIAFNQIGASTMSGTAVDEINIEEQIYSVIYNHVLKAGAHNRLKASPLIKYKKEHIARDEFIFMIENCAEVPYYFNILKFGKKANLCFVPLNESNCFDMFLPANSIVELTQNVFADTDDKRTRYIIFATEKPFNQQVLQDLLHENKKTKVKAENMNVIFGLVKE